MTLAEVQEKRTLGVAKMKRLHLFPLILTAAAAAVPLLPWTGARAASPAEAAVHSPPARLEPVAGTTLLRISLTEKAAARLDIRTDEVREAAPGGEKIVPYAAVLYDLAGKPWVYTSTAPLSFLRHPVVVGRIEGGTAYLKDGPAAGVRVVTVGVPQLFGAEMRVGH
jgi:hypothetical protein